MVIRLIFLLFLFPFSLFSGEFIASVKHQQVNSGESLILNLTLKNASAREVPATASLSKHFYIQSQQQSNSTSIINGQISSNISWKLTLIPQREGEIVIPPISIESSEGTLTSQPITIRVVKNNGSDNVNSHSSDGVKMVVDVNNAKPYKNESVIYTVRLTSRDELANVKMQKFKIDDAMVETNGEPKVYTKVINGINMSIIEFSYLITPLKATSLKIPSTLIQGLAPTQERARRDSFFHDDFDFFSMIQGFDRLKPFNLMTEEIVLNVQPAIAGMTPWIPAKSFMIEEQWNENQVLQVGEPIARVFNITADGLKSSQLPNLGELQTNQESFKIYADKPELKEEIKNGSVHSSRREQYTLIPQQSGTLILPELSVAWWDVVKKEKVYTKIPSRTLSVLPLPQHVNKSQLDVPSSIDNLTTPLPIQSPVIQRDPLLYALIGGLIILLIAAIFWGISLQKKILRFSEPSIDSKREEKEASKELSKQGKYDPFSDDDMKENSPEKGKRTKKEKLPDLNPT